MRISALTSIFFGLLLLATLGSGALTLWHTAQSRHWDQRIGLAQASYAEHLSLQSNIYQLFKQHGDALLLGNRDNGRLEADLRARITANLAQIRTLIGQEIQLVGEEEFAELDLLAQIEGKVQSLTTTLATLTPTDGPIDTDQQRLALVGLLDGEIDTQLAQQITEALEGEQEEVAETLANAEAFRLRIQRMVSAIMAAALGLAAIAGWTYRTQIVRPTLALVHKVKAFRSGQTTVTTPGHGASELRHLDHVLSDMMAALTQRDHDRREQTHLLEQAVQARTQELGQVLTQIENSETTRRQMLADVSHELRTPLTIIHGEAEVSLRGAVKSPAEYIDAFTRIRDTARHTNHIVDDLLLIARQESGKLRLDLRDVDLYAILRDAAGLLPRSVTLDGGLHSAPIKADPMRLRQCLLALFQNATRYGGSTIWARVETAANGYALVVEDNGPGMSDGEKATAFDRFFRGSNAAKPDVDGTGLGLPIVRSIAVAHGGSVTLHDRDGGGLRVVLTLAAERSIGLVWDRSAHGAADH